jgi:hypothetical protein
MEGVGKNSNREDAKKYGAAGGAEARPYQDRV